MKKQFLNTVYFFTLAILLSACMLFTSCAYSGKAAAKLLLKARTKSYDMIVVPGVPFTNNQWDKVMRGRVLWSKYLYDQGIAKNIMYSGSSVYSAYYEGEIMALYAHAIGIPSEHIFTETKAEHSTENIFYSYKKAQKAGFKTIALASDPFQTKSLRRFTQKKISTDVDFIPWVRSIVLEMDKKLAPPGIDYLQAENKAFISIKKRQGLMKRLKGTRGKNIDAHLYE